MKAGRTIGWILAGTLGAGIAGAALAHGGNGAGGWGAQGGWGQMGRGMMGPGMMGPGMMGPGMMGPGMMGPGMMGPGMMGPGGHHGPAAGQNLDALAERLALRDDQEAAWDAFRDTVSAQRRAAFAEHQAGCAQAMATAESEAGEPGNAFQGRIRAMERGVERMRAVGKAYADLEAVLDEAQRATLAQSLRGGPGFGRFGPRHGAF